MTTPTATPAYAPEACHAPAVARPPRALRFAPTRDFAAWQRQVRATVQRLLGPDPALVPLALVQEWEVTHADYREIRFRFTAEAGAEVPCHLLLPTRGPGPFPVVICLQGHSTGMHISLARAVHPGDDDFLTGDRDFGLQAVREGYAALVLEQRAFGERRDQRVPSATFKQSCHHAAMTALLLGRTLIGERVWDVRRAIDALAAFPAVDRTRIGCMGNSGGGTITTYAACVEPRISIAMPSCALCTFRDSIASLDHCACNYLPGILTELEMADLAALIAPRPLLVVSGATDDIFPLAGVRECVGEMQQIYAAAGAPTRLQWVIGDGGHRFYAAPAWPVFRQLAGW